MFAKWFSDTSRCLDYILTIDNPEFENISLICIRKNLSLGLSLLVFYVTCTDISVIFVTAQMYRRTEEECVPMVGLPTPKTFPRVLLHARPTPTRDHPFIR